MRCPSANELYTSCADMYSLPSPFPVCFPRLPSPLSPPSAPFSPVQHLSCMKTNTYTHHTYTHTLVHHPPPPTYFQTILCFFLVKRRGNVSLYVSPPEWVITSNPLARHFPAFDCILYTKPNTPPGAFPSSNHSSCLCLLVGR